MSLAEYFGRYPQLVSSKSAYLEKEFLEKIFYPEFGDAGLDRLRYQQRIYNSMRRCNYYIDFVVNVDGRQFAIEIDGYNYHGRLSAKEFEKQEERLNEITYQGYELIRFSYSMISGKPNEVRRELRRRINIPYSVSTPPASSSNAVVPIAKKSNEGPAVIMLSLIVLLSLIFVPFALFIKMNPGVSRFDGALDSSELSGIQSFVEYFNDQSDFEILNLEEIDLGDEASEFYRSTNTRAGRNAVAMHGLIGDSDIWITRCNDKYATGMRIYAESTNHDLLVNLVHVGIPYFNPNKTNNTDRLNNFDSMIQRNSYGIFIGSINNTYTVLSQNKETTALLPKNEVENWRLNMNTDCNNLFY